MYFLAQYAKYVCTLEMLMFYFMLNKITILLLYFQINSIPKTLSSKKSHGILRAINLDIFHIGYKVCKMPENLLHSKRVSI